MHGFQPFFKQKSSNIVLLPHLLLKFSNNILQIEYQMLVLAHTDLKKYEAIFYKQKI